MSLRSVSSSPAPPGESSTSAVVVLSLDDDDDGASSTVRDSSPSVRHPKRRRADPPVAADSPPVIDLTSETVDLTVPLPNNSNTVRGRSSSGAADLSMLNPRNPLSADPILPDPYADNDPTGGFWSQFERFTRSSVRNPINSFIFPRAAPSAGGAGRQRPAASSPVLITSPVKSGKVAAKAAAAPAAAPEPVSVATNLTCAVCLDHPRNPTASKCGHIFCEECIKVSIQTFKQCPSCRTPLRPNQVQRLYF